VHASATQSVADVVGLYFNPPKDALVLCVDENPCIQALERAQGESACPTVERSPALHTNTSFVGPTSLLAALEVATRLVQFRDCAKHEPADPSKAVNADFVMMILVC